MIASSGTFSYLVNHNFYSQIFARPQPFLHGQYLYLITYDSNKDSCGLNYALFQPRAPIMEDKDFVYTNIFDAMVDTYFLTEAIRYAGVLIMITQSV